MGADAIAFSWLKEAVTLDMSLRTPAWAFLLLHNQPRACCLFLFVVIVIIGHFINYFHSHNDLMR